MFFTKHVWVQLVKQKHHKHEKWLVFYPEVLKYMCVYLRADPAQQLELHQVAQRAFQSDLGKDKCR